MGIRSIHLINEEIEDAVQPVVTYDGRILAKAVELDSDGEVIPDPSWVAFMKDMREGKNRDAAIS